MTTAHPFDYSNATATPASGDFVPFIDISDGNKVKRATITNLIDAAGSQTDQTIGTATITTANITTLNVTGSTTSSVTNAITAFATGGQASATALTTTLNRITTCATAGDSVKLPAAAAGRTVRVINSGAAYANVFPVSGEVIDTLTANLAVSVPVGQEITFSCEVAGTWISSGLVYMPAKFTTGTTTTTFAAGQLTGAARVNYTNTQGTPGSIAFRTAAQMFADDPYARVGSTYSLVITNGQGTGTLTVTGGASGITLTGTATIAINTWREYLVTYTSQSALVIQNIATGTFS